MFRCKSSKQDAAVIDLEVISCWIVDPEISFYSTKKSCWLMGVQSCAERLQSHGHEGGDGQIAFYLWT